eukprot:g2108.t1
MRKRVAELLGDSGTLLQLHRGFAAQSRMLGLGGMAQFTRLLGATKQLMDAQLAAIDERLPELMAEANLMLVRLESWELMEEGGDRMDGD